MLNRPNPVTLAALTISLIGGFGCLSGLTEEMRRLDPPGELTHLELFVPTAASPETNRVLHLRGADARQQLLVTASFSAGGLRDYTREVSYQTSPAGVVQVSKTGRVTPLADGTATITAKLSDGSTATLFVSVEQFKDVPLINFPNQIVPMFTKAGCNAGGCHGKSSGQNGFKLSLLGFEPTEDYEHLVNESRGRRLFPAAPDHSLLLEKAAATVPHGGGKRLDSDTSDYRLLRRWVAQGMPYGNTNDPVVTRIEVFPKERVASLGAEQSGMSFPCRAFLGAPEPLTS